MNQIIYTLKYGWLGASVFFILTFLTKIVPEYASNEVMYSWWWICIPGAWLVFSFYHSILKDGGRHGGEW